jgi:hypothetical protein
MNNMFGRRDTSLQAEKNISSTFLKNGELKPNTDHKTLNYMGHFRSFVYGEHRAVPQMSKLK